jgi:hypothetical protein
VPDSGSPGFEPIELTPDRDDVRVVAELVEVLSPSSPAGRPPPNV